MKPDDVGLELILAEERSRETGGTGVGTGTGAAQPAHEQLVIDRKNVTTSSAFHISEPGTSLPVSGPGTLKSAVVIGDGDDFDITFEVDGQTVVGESFKSLQGVSSEVARVAAYNAEIGYVFSAGEFEFQQAVDIVITPHEEISFRRQRAQFDLVRDN